MANEILYLSEQINWLSDRLRSIHNVDPDLEEMDVAGIANQLAEQITNNLKG